MILTVRAMEEHDNDTQVQERMLRYEMLRTRAAAAWKEQRAKEAEEVNRAENDKEAGS
jgi:hypothetical protein